VHLSYPTTLRTEAGGQIVSPGGHTAIGTEAGGQTVSPGGHTPLYKGWWSDRHPGRSDSHDLRRSFVTCFTDFDRPPCGAHNCTRAMRGPDVYDYGRTTHCSEVLHAPLLASPSGCTRATGTTSTSAVTAGEGHTSGTSSQSSSDDHAGEARLPASSRQTQPCRRYSPPSAPPSPIQTGVMPWKKSLLP
jgi:hypothetical protein